MQEFEKAKALFFDGLRELEQGRPLEAERCFRGSLALVPNRVSTLVNLSSSLIRQRRAAEAGEVAQQVLAIDKQAADGWLNLGLASQGLGDLKQALDCMDRALQINPAYAEAFSDKGVILTEMQRLDEALAEIGDVFLIQKDVSEGDRKFLALNPGIQFLGDRLDDFDETAAIVHHMDVVVSVDTSLAHLAGTMGKRLYVLLPWIAEWRWRLQGETTPWYPSATLLRQPVESDWDSVVGDLVSRLQA